MIYGRDAERAHLADVAEAARAGISTALVVSGEAGAGKSALLDDLAARALGMRTLRVAGLESESELAFGGLRRLLEPLLSGLDALTPPRRQALAAALGLAEAERAPNRFPVAAAVLDLLAGAAEREPLLAIVDDAQWLDGGSRDALLFVARRLAGEGVALLFAARDGGERSFEAPGVPRLVLTGLSEDATLELIEHWSEAAPSASVAARIVAATGGNPLALTELAATLDRAILSGAAPLPEPLAVARGMEAAFLERVLRLPRRTRVMLLLAALEPAADRTVLARSGVAEGALLLDLEPAESEGLVRLDLGRVVFDHPLVRSAVEAGATDGDRRRAHLALAAALPADDRERRAWHAAAAATQPDELVAAELEQIAAQARERAGDAAAQAALMRAAELTPDAAARGHRLVAAADAAWRCGRAADALALIERALPLLELPGGSARAARLRGLITLRTGSLPDAHRLLLDAARDASEVDPRTAYMLVGEAAKAAGFAGNAAWQAAAADLTRSLPEPDDHASRIIRRAVMGIGRLASGDAAEASAEIAEVVAAAQRMDDPQLLEYGITIAWLTGDRTLSAQLLARAERVARERTMIDALPLLLLLRSLAEYDAGRLAAAASTADEGSRLARETGQTTLLAANLAHAARAAAVRGDATRFATAAGESSALAAGHGLDQVQSIAAHATALHELGMGRYEAASEALLRVDHPSLAASRASDACEIAIHLDRTAEAAAELAQLEQRAEALRLPWVDGLLERARGMTTSAKGDWHFQRAIGLQGDHRPFERARTELVFGETLRRTRRRMDARPPLRSALDAFERMGAEPWAARADRELRATGETATRREPSKIDQLTPQELSICRLAAKGLSDREIAARLFLSARTIDYHLQRVLPKLGVDSRAELVRLDPGAAE
ncbi:MAG TPA: AAA family ATPase [Gaiellales bacterium]|nr:AAA family ATPase [Gaiellales bacterium]